MTVYKIFSAFPNKSMVLLFRKIEKSLSNRVTFELCAEDVRINQAKRKREEVSEILKK